MYKKTTLSQGVEIIRLLAHERTPMGVTQVSKALDLPKSSTHRLLKILESLGFTKQNKDNLLYSVNPGIFGFIYELASKFGPNSKVDPILRDAAIRLKCSIYLSMLEGRNTYVVCAVGKDGGTTHLGSHGPVHASSAGKVLVAQRPESEWLEYAPRPGDKSLTAFTNLDAEHFCRELREARSKGFAWNVREAVESSVSIASPVRERFVAYPRMAVALVAEWQDSPDHDIWEKQIIALGNEISEAISLHV